MQLKQSIKPPPRSVRNFKATQEEMELIRKRAEKYTNGNVSEWIRYAASQLDPRPKDLANKQL